MIWESWDAFWAMGGYGLYVWGSYGMTLLVLFAEAWAVRQRRRQALASARNKSELEDGR